MKHARLELARGADLLPALQGTVAVFGQIELDRLRGLDLVDLRCVSASYLTHNALKRKNIDVSQSLSNGAAHAAVFVVRAKDEVWDLISQAVAAAPQGWIIVDGQKTDGIDSIAKQISRTVPDVASYAKGHGKTIWFRAEDAGALAKERIEMRKNKSDYVTAPGVFSADAIDPASLVLTEHLPVDLSGDIADFGAGWGYLTDQVLSRSSKIRSLHLVEDNAKALNCARENVVDSRAQFHWADALSWHAPAPLDAVIMNPPFHTTRRADPALGIAFIQAAARALKPGGKLYMVANAHLPYESALEQRFDPCELLIKTNRFKVFCATRSRVRTV